MPTIENPKQIQINMKIPKPLVLYTDTPPPPLVWTYECQYCQFFESPDNCSIVDKGNGVISPTAWCILWWPQKGYKPFTQIPTLIAR